MKRKALNRQLPKRLLILCEGESEVKYFTSYRYDNANKVRLRGVEIEIFQPDDYSPVGLIKEAKRKIQEARREKLPTFEAVWIVFDKDGHANIPQAFEMARINNPRIFIAFSAICFEIWIMLHFQQKKLHFKNSEELVKYLVKNCNLQYQKSKLIFNDLHHLLNTALANCAWLHKQNENDLNNGKRPYDLDTYTSVDKLMKALEDLNKPAE